MNKNAACWILCVCGDFWCIRHAQHVHDCDCPSVEDWPASPYLAAALEGASRNKPTPPKQ